MSFDQWDAGRRASSSNRQSSVPPWSRLPVWGHNGLAGDALFGPVQCLHATQDRNPAEINAMVVYAIALFQLLLFCQITPQPHHFGLCFALTR